MNKEYYTIKEIILGLRPYYLENEKKIKLLKDMCYSLDKNVKDFNFFIVGSNESYIEPGMYCEYIQNIKTFRGMRSYLIQKMNISTFNYNGIAKLNTNVYGDYFVDSDYFKVDIKSGNMKNFSLLLNDILKSEFANNLYFYYGKNNAYIIDIIPSMLRIITYIFGDLFTIEYDIKNDKIHITNFKNIPVYNEIIYQILNYKISKELLPEYIINLIDNSNIKDKKVQISNDYGLNNNYIVDFNINESDDTIFLERTKYKKKVLSKRS